MANLGTVRAEVVVRHVHVSPLLNGDGHPLCAACASEGAAAERARILAALVRVRDHYYGSLHAPIFAALRAEIERGADE